MHAVELRITAETRLERLIAVVIGSLNARSAAKIHIAKS